MSLGLKSELIIAELTRRIPEIGPEFVKKVGAVLGFEIAKVKGGPTMTWTVDLKNGTGKCDLSLTSFRIRERRTPRRNRSSLLHAR